MQIRTEPNERIQRLIPYRVTRVPCLVRTFTSAFFAHTSPETHDSTGNEHNIRPVSPTRTNRKMQNYVLCRSDGHFLYLSFVCNAHERGKSACVCWERWKHRAAANCICKCGVARKAKHVLSKPRYKRESVGEKNQFSLFTVHFLSNPLCDFWSNEPTQAKKSYGSLV